MGTLVGNLRKRPKKDSALELLEQAAVGRRATTQVLQRALLRHETRELAGKQATTARQRQAAEAVRQALPRIAAGLAAMAAQQAATVRQVGYRAALVHSQTEGEITRTPSCYARAGRRRTESGRPVANIRFSTATAMAASVC